jgi:hypothetical protein
MKDHDVEGMGVLLAEYRARKMREHMVGPGVSFVFHMLLIVLLALLAGGRILPKEKDPVIITVVPEFKPIVLPPKIPDDPLRTIEPDLALPTPPTPPPPPMPEPERPSQQDAENLEAVTDMPEPGDDWEMLEFTEIAPIQTPFQIPGLYAERGTGSRQRLLKQGEMTASGQNAVHRALRWLARVQMDDGSWERAPALTGLALLCFLAHGDTPLSEDFGLTVQKAMQWLAAAMPADGRAIGGKHGGVYDHGIATYALSEGYGMTQIPMLRTAAANGLAVIVKGQQRDGGWNYNYDDKGRWDLSVSAWQMQALKAGYVAGLDVPGLCDAMESARAFTKRCFNGQTFGYSSPGGSSNLTGAGVLCLQILGDADSAEAQAGVDYVLDKRRESFAAARNDWRSQGGPIYGWYYDTQAAFHAGRKHWSSWRAVFDRVLTQNQHPDGYWDMEAKHAVGSPLAEDVYHTTLCCLQLEVYYRYLPSLKLGDGCGEDSEVVNLLDDDDGDLIIQ